MARSEIVDRMAALARGLLAKTRAGEIEWTPLADEPYAYRATLPSGTVHIVSLDGDGVRPYGLYTFSPSGGDALDGITTRSTNAATRPISDLYEQVDRMMRGADEILEGLIRDVGEEEIPF